MGLSERLKDLKLLREGDRLHSHLSAFEKAAEAIMKATSLKGASKQECLPKDIYAKLELHMVKGNNWTAERGPGCL